MDALSAPAVQPEVNHRLGLAITSCPRSFGDLNWLCLYLVFLVIPVVELLGIFSGQPPSVPVPSAVAINLFALIMTFGGASKLAFAPESRLHRWIIFWFAGSSLLLCCNALLSQPVAGSFLKVTVPLALMLASAALLFSIRYIAAEHRKISSLLAGGAAVFYGSACVHGMLLITVADLPYVYDPVLYRIEAILGLNWITPFVAVANPRAGLGSLLFLLYNSLNIAIIFAAISEFAYARDRLQASLILRFLVVAVIGYCLYYLMPALDPAGFFGAAFPDHLPAAQSVADGIVKAPYPASASVPRNTMPSLHAAWSLLALLALRHSPLWHKILGALFVLAILIVTLGIGAHYTIDWVAALPLVLLARGISALSLPLQAAARRNAIGAGILLLCGWITVVRGAPDSLNDPGFIQVLAILSVGLPFWLETQLAKAEARQSPPKTQLRPIKITA